MLPHGFDRDKSEWLPVAKIITKHFHVIIPDLRGWGDSSRVTGGNVDIDAQAMHLQQFVQALGLRNFMLVGHSMGGAIAGVFAKPCAGRRLGDILSNFQIEICS